MKRALLNLVTVLSLLLCVAAAAMWVRSKTYLTMVMLWESSEGAWTVGPSTHDGDLYFHYVEWEGGRPPKRARRLIELQSGPAPFGEPDAGFAGFGYHIRRRGWGPPDDPWIRVPLWSVLIAAGVLPVLRFVAWKRRRPPEGLCPTCGYDLRATPGRCPECGWKVMTPE